MNLDGGANAIKGFNYQKAVIALVAVLNYHKEDFEIFLENRDDLEVLFKNSHTFIQIKSNKNLSIASLIKADAKTNQSIFSKNLNKEPSGERLGRYKIITPDLSKNDKNRLKEVGDSLIFDEVYGYCNDQKNVIFNTLKNQSIEESDLDRKIANSYLYFSPFKADLNSAIPFIKGKMSDCNISVDNNKGDIAINELFTQIDNRSEIPPTQEVPYNEKKKITNDDLRIIFTISGHEDIKDRIWKDVKSNFNQLDQLKIEKEFMRVIPMHKALKNEMVEKIGSFTTNMNSQDLMDSLYKKVQNLEISNSVLYALLVVIISEKMQEELLCS
jgi:hypothetical protein